MWETYKMQMNQAHAEHRIADLGMGDLPLMQYRPAPPRIAPDWFAKYRETVKKFMMSLADSVDSLAFMNLSQDEFMSLIMGRAMPENLSVRMRVPLMLGGEISVNNMFLCRTFPHANNMDRFIVEQAGANEYWLPNPAKKVYLPAHTAGGGEGGNATEDRLSQMAAHLANDRGMD